MSAIDWMTFVPSVILAVVALFVVVLGYCNRRERRRGIGWQFIRYIVLGVGLPIAAILALNDALTGEAATIIAAAMGYAFGKSGNNSDKKKKAPSAQGVLKTRNDQPT